jgi:hypothetical protein
MRINARLPIDANKTLYVVTVGKATVLLGGSEAGLHLITRLEAADVEGTSLASDRPDDDSSTGFAHYLRPRNSREES